MWIGDGVGSRALLTPDLRVLTVKTFAGEPGAEPVSFTQLVGPGDYLLRVDPANSEASPLIQAEFVPGSNPLLPTPIGSFVSIVITLDVDRDGPWG